MDAAPPLSVILAAREGLDELERAMAALLPQARATETEILVVGPVAEQPGDPVRVIRMDDPDIFRLRLAGIEQARGSIVAVGEDHAIPRGDWCEAVIRAHAEMPGAPAIAGCLSNGTHGMLAGRVNYLAFAAPYEPPMPALPPLRPPPVSAVTFKRGALEEARHRPGHFETVLLPRMFQVGQIAADDRIIVDHFQDHGLLWTTTNAFHSARSSYGYASSGLSRDQRVAQARWSLVNWPRVLLTDARSATHGQPRRRAELALVAVVVCAAAVGAAAGSVGGAGGSPRVVA